MIEERMGGSAQYVFVARRLDPSTWTRIKKDPGARAARQVAARSSREQEPRRVYPEGRPRAHRSSASTAPASPGVELSRNDVLSARDGLASVSKVNDRPTGDTPLGARAARARAGAGQGRAAHARHAHPVGSCRRRSRATARHSGRPRRSRPSCSTRAPAASSRWPSAPGVPPAGYRAGNAEEWRLRAITDLYEPGSTFKLVTFMGALQEGDDHAAARRSACPVLHVRSASTQQRPLDRRRAPAPTENWTATDILAHSSNVGTITIADKRLGADGAAEVDPPHGLRQAHRRRSAR